MSVWYCIPSARPVAEAEPVLVKWRAQGYKIALWRDELADLSSDVLLTGGYPGYAKATNQLICCVLERDAQMDFCLIGGDDIEPDPNHTAAEIARECLEWRADTFGVMQPTGDRWGENPGHPDPRMRSAYIDRVCGSAWLGREFCRRMYQGNGPLWPGYTHMYVDEELFEVSKAMGILWQRPDLIHLHKHWARTPNATMEDCPEFLAQANSPQGWADARAMFQARKDAGFPGYEPCA